MSHLSRLLGCEKLKDHIVGVMISSGCVCGGMCGLKVRVWVVGCWIEEM